MNIRQAELKDVSHMAEVVVTTWKIAYKGMISQSYLNKLTTATYVERFKRQIQSKKSQFLVAEINYTIVGVIQAHVDNKEAMIDMLYILPHYQQKGVGSALLNYIISDNQDLEKIRLNVLEKNFGAKLFYERQGFVFTGQKQKSEINSGVFWVEKFERILKKS